jgi:hypothetical protein
MDTSRTPWALMGEDPSKFFNPDCIPADFNLQDPSRMGAVNVKQLLNHLRDRQQVLGVNAFHFHHVMKDKDLVKAEYPQQAKVAIQAGADVLNYPLEFDADDPIIKAADKPETKKPPNPVAAGHIPVQRPPYMPLAPDRSKPLYNQFEGDNDTEANRLLVQKGDLDCVNVAEIKAEPTGPDLLTGPPLETPLRFEPLPATLNTGPVQHSQGYPYYDHSGMPSQFQFIRPTQWTGGAQMSHAEPANGGHREYAQPPSHNYGYMPQHFVPPWPGNSHLATSEALPHLDPDLLALSSPLGVPGDPRTLPPGPPTFSNNSAMDLGFIFPPEGSSAVLPSFYNPPFVPQVKFQQPTWSPSTASPSKSPGKRTPAKRSRANDDDTPTRAVRSRRRTQRFLDSQQGDI